LPCFQICISFRTYEIDGVFVIYAISCSLCGTSRLCRLFVSVIICHFRTRKSLVVCKFILIFHVSDDSYFNPSIENSKHMISFIEMLFEYIQSCRILNPQDSLRWISIIFVFILHTFCIGNKTKTLRTLLPKDYFFLNKTAATFRTSVKIEQLERTDVQVAVSKILTLLIYLLYIKKSTFRKLMNLPTFCTLK
jgi:hypothetical protein